ncbi:hypothetical protein [Rhizobium leguminosarum]|nr:hypothetical protein [Rhizobium leguminosarum]MBY2943919.1 hypothetical protein [Rhizobium leguminosarum]
MKILRVVIAVRLASRDHEQVLRQFVLEESRTAISTWHSSSTVLRMS